MRKKRIIQLSSVAMLFISTLVFAEKTTLSDNFETGLAKWDKPSSSALKTRDEKLINKTKYAVNVAFKEKNIEGFVLSFKLKLLKKTSNEAGHFTIGINRGNGKWGLYLQTCPGKTKILSIFHEKGKKKAVHRKEFVAFIPIGKWLNIKIVCDKDEYKLTVGDKTFSLGTAPGQGGFSLGSYRQPFAVDDLKINYEKPSNSQKDVK